MLFHETGSVQISVDSGFWNAGEVVGVLDGGDRPGGCLFIGSFEPGLWGKEDERDDKQAENVVLPGAAFVIPKDNSFHKNELAELTEFAGLAKLGELTGFGELTELAKSTPGN